MKKCEITVKSEKIVATISKKHYNTVICAGNAAD